MTIRSRTARPRHAAKVAAGVAALLAAAGAAAPTPHGSTAPAGGRSTSGPAVHQTDSEAPPLGPGAVPAVSQGSQANTFAHLAVAAAPTPDGRGFWVVWADGAVTATGTAHFFGDASGLRLNAPVVGISPTASGLGYWLLARDGGVFTFGDATFAGSTGNVRLIAPALAMTTPGAHPGYYFVAGDGGVFSFGGAAFHGSTGGMRLNRPVVGMASARDGGGYWLVASDGGVFSFGSAPFEGSTGGARLNQPVVAMAPTASGKGYWFVAADGGVFSFGDAAFHGSAVGQTGGAQVVGLIATADGGGYWIVLANGAVLNYGNAPAVGSTPAPSASSSGGYTYEVTNGAGTPIRWNACEAIHYSVLPAGGPASSGADIAGALHQVSSATGLSFVQDGAYASASQVPASTKLTFSYTSSLSGGDAVGLTTYHYMNDPRYTPQITDATVQLLSRLSSGGGSSGEVPVILHELGHVVGLGHFAGAEVMNPVDQGYASYQAGDLAGLSTLGASAGCAGFYR